MKFNHKLFIVAGIIVYALAFGILGANAQSATNSPAAGTGAAGVRNAGLRANNQVMRQDNQMMRADLRDDKKAEFDAMQRERQDFKDGMKNASVTPEQRIQMMRDGKDQMQANRKAAMEKVKIMKQDAFAKIRENNNKQLDNVAKILDGAYAKLLAFITKLSTEGKTDVTEAKKLLAVADAAIKKAKVDILAFKNFKPQVATPAIVTATNDATQPASIDKTAGPQVDVEKPRALAQAARASIEAAHKALRAVAISLGYGNQNPNGSNGQGLPAGGKLPVRPGVNTTTTNTAQPTPATEPVTVPNNQ